MKQLMLALALTSTTSLAHEGHNHGIPPTQMPVVTEPEAPATQTPITAACVQGPENFSELAAHLSYPNAAVHVHAYWKQIPVLGQPAILKLEIRNAKNHSLSLLQSKIEVVLFHEEMGHESTATKINPFHDEVGDLVVGTFVVSKIDFQMAGTWSVKINLINLKGEIESNQFAVGF